MDSCLVVNPHPPPTKKTFGPSARSRGSATRGKVKENNALTKEKVLVSRHAIITAMTCQALHREEDIEGYQRRIFTQ